MKKIFYFIMAIALLCGCESPEEEKLGRIHGTITDKATGELIRSAGVQLNPIGIQTVTGNDGQYEFTDLKAGDYTLQVTKTGYTDLLNHKITVVAGKSNQGSVQMEKLPPSLRVVNDSKQDISELDFGSAEADVARSFSVFNDGPEKLEWEITKTNEWISEISKTSGTLNAGATQAIIVTIDRSKLATGDNTTTIHITSDNGSKQLTIKVTNGRKAPVLNTLATTNIAATTATFNGEIMDAGSPAYTERGFVYATTTMPTIETTIAKSTVEVTGTAKFSTNVLGLTLGNTYFVRAYAINSTGTAYSTNEVSFTTRNPDYEELSLEGLMVQRTDISSGSKWSAANTLCMGSRVGGYSDWRLPTIGELATLYAKKGEIGGFSDGTYWSSTSAGTDIWNNNLYYSFSFNGGNQYSYRGDDYGAILRVRAVRTLP